MYQFIFVTWIIITFMCGCTHMKKDGQQGDFAAAAKLKLGPSLCSETKGDAHHLRLTVDLKIADLKEWAIHKQVEIPYFNRRDGSSPMRISRDLLIWQNNHIVLAEIQPTETTDVFTLYVTSFEKSKQDRLTSSAHLILRLCQNAEMTMTGDNKIHSLKARLELVGQPKD